MVDPYYMLEDNGDFIVNLQNKVVGSLYSLIGDFGKSQNK